MIVYPNCKINLGLHILGKRDDGFHNLETVFYPVEINDALEIIQHSDGEVGQLDFTTTGITLDGRIEDNICYKAWQLIKEDYPSLPSLKIHLHKAIPAGAGLGGGSADGSFCLRLLNRKCNLSIPEDKLFEYAARLGSDCPFFLFNKPCIASGRGEKLEPIDLDLSAYKIALVIPPVHINTAWAFGQSKSYKKHPPIRDLIQEPVSKWKDLLHNDFEEVVFAKYPEIKQVKEQLYAEGAIYASLSGSGSSVFALFEAETTLPLSFPPTYFVKLLG
ncbi:MAG TPA: 4-(cytidine 5'-diphospho)-2-C-methyl-D-erythritol kinase [Chitinophagaceae bacterium]